MQAYKLWARLRASKLARLASACVLVVAVGFILIPLPQAARHPDFARLVTARDGSLLRAYLSQDQKWRFRADSSQLPVHVREGLKCIEDKRFNSHPGVDPLAIFRATRQNLIQRRVVSGGSTLTMQLVRLMEPRPRTLSSKAIEAFRAIHLEAHLSKTEILDLYLSYAPFGSNIEGIEAAAQRYFQKPARLLSPAETAFLLLLPQSPKRWDRRSAVNLRLLRDRNLARMSACGLLTTSEHQQSLAEPIPEWRSKFETRAAHFSDWVSNQSIVNGEIRTSIDRHLQRTLEDMTNESEARLRELGILNIAVLVVENKSGAIRAAIGNHDYTRNGDSQKFASFVVPRSPGSLLKPFLYGRLIETGEILPESLIEDVPFDVDGYQPKNYDGEFTGLVEAKIALSNSLNVPWVKKLRDIRIESFLNFLLESDLKTPQTPDQLGLSLAIGGMEVPLLDLVRMYSALANDGRIRPLKWLNTEASPVTQDRHWLHPGAAHLVREGLSIRGRPDFAIDPRWLTNSQARWKTGTSQGNHDAWAIGFDSDFTVGVWLGNLDNRATPSLVGPEVAAPLMFDAMARARRVSASIAKEWVASGLEDVEVCSFSGLPPGSACVHTKFVKGVEGLAMRARCSYHQHILVDANSGMRITRECETDEMKADTRPVLELPSDVADWARRHLARAELSPSFHPACRTRPVASGRLRIMTPEPTTYIVYSGLAEASQARRKPSLHIPLYVKSPGDSSAPRCYLNGSPVRDGSRGAKPLLDIPVGDYVLLCTDDQGRSDQVAFSVEI